ALVEAARTYQAWRDYEHAAAAWQSVLSQDATNIEFWKARWECLAGMAEEGLVDTSQVCKSISAEAEQTARFLSEENRLEILTISSKMAFDTTQFIVYLDSLARVFPNNQTGYDFLGEVFYDSLYPIWRDAEKKILFCNRFTQEYPQSFWRNEAYRFLLSACKDAGRNDSLFFYAERWMNEETASPLPYSTAAAWCVRLDTLPTQALSWSERALELSKTYHFPEAKHPMQRSYETKRLWLSSHESLVWSLWKNGETEKALQLYRNSIDASPLDMEDDFTLCGLHVLAAWNYLASGDSASAKLALAEALIAGDRRNFWTPKADSTLQAIGVTEPLEFVREATNYTGPVFQDVTDEVGLDGYRQSRVAWGDFDNDGDDDLLLSGSVLLRNDDGVFIDITETAGITGGASGGVWGDYDNDGHLDFYAMGGGECGDKLWHALADGTFDDATEQAGMMCDSSSSEGAAWADANNDGFLDLYIANYEKSGSLGSGTPDILYVNQGDGTFRRETSQRGMTPPFDEPRCGRGVAWCDFDGDGDNDCHVSNYRLQENFLFQNNSRGEFINVAPELHLNGEENDGWFGHTIGSEWGDFDNDGDFDLICANLAHPRYIEFSNKTMLYVNPGKTDSLWKDERAFRGIKFEETHSDPAWGDVDGDGYLDLYVTSIYENLRSFLYLNESGHFTDATYLAGVRTFNGWGCAFSDYDSDGDLDLIVGSGSGVRLFRNETNPQGWLEIKLVDVKGNRSAVGIILELAQGELLQLRQIQGGKGTTSQHSFVQYFGGLDVSKLSYLTLFIPGGRPQTYEIKNYNRRLTITIKATAGRRL
ncbi:VCBS repeat-containing protein, partial [bacterium]|nr:VCBS repeat-containing protein [bacterium]